MRAVYMEPGLWSQLAGTVCGAQTGGKPFSANAPGTGGEPTFAANNRASDKVAQPSRLRVPAASRRRDERAGRPFNPQARTPALHFVTGPADRFIFLPFP